MTLSTGFMASVAEQRVQPPPPMVLHIPELGALLSTVGAGVIKARQHLK